MDQLVIAPHPELVAALPCEGLLQQLSKVNSVSLGIHSTPEMGMAVTATRGRHPGTEGYVICYRPISSWQWTRITL